MTPMSAPPLLLWRGLGGGGRRLFARGRGVLDPRRRGGCVNPPPGGGDSPLGSGGGRGDWDAVTGHGVLEERDESP
eukprot:CAMPEP_0206255110 /NCGR_PEP_ID=MMETSP0047_2-20121206/24066_1 /ASSEMBLY_ACC=CAM_ASM_000192 /TAXON_ID=195065 /ORGANISM="Chroomonas mesostigmatica_cf, Strain CCMP1168" /LENGTH=75 /DNA_ID=CAMNT_0053681475 /DNA_START=1087 /DNA_END=1311 /DNA_ORIENTATION=+